MTMTVVQAIKIYYYSVGDIEIARKQFHDRLMKLEKEELVEFIIETQNRGCFKGICY
jgi:hypothetical protein